jgi:predicted O-methyltransferase YrrM
VNIARAVNIMGWMSEPELRWLAKQAAARHVIIEIGSFEGRSTMALADHTPGFVIAVDPWMYKLPHKAQSYDRFLRNLSAHIEAGTVRPVRARSDDCLQPVCEALGIHKPDMVFIDGNHDYEVVLHDIKLARSLLLPGGLLCGHDYGHRTLPGVKKAVDELCPSVMVVDSIWWTLT